MEKILFMPSKNKIYKMNKSNNNTFTVTFGQVGKSMHEKIFPLSEWDNVYQEKITLGYIDQTEIYNDNNIVVEKKTVLSFDKYLNDVLLTLKEMSRQIVSDNYKVSNIVITEKMIKTAERLLLELEQAKTIWEFNEKLMELFSVIPRKMTNVISNTAKNEKDFDSILEREKDLLQNLVVNKPDKETVDNHVTYDICNADEIAKIKSMLDNETFKKFKNVWKVSNSSCETNYRKYINDNAITNTKLLFHGSRSENWWSIIQTKLLKKPTNVVTSGSMFGSGIYFANKAAKSVGYTSIIGSRWAGGNDRTAYLGIYEVAYGNPQDIYEWKSEYSLLTNEVLKNKYPGKNCVHAHAGKDLLNDEIIIYDENACSIRYLIEIEK